MAVSLTQEMVGLDMDDNLPDMVNAPSTTLTIPDPLLQEWIEEEVLQHLGLIKASQDSTDGQAQEVAIR